MMPATVPGRGTRSPRAAGALKHLWGDLKGDGVLVVCIAFAFWDLHPLLFT